MRSSPYAYHIANDLSEEESDGDALDYHMAAAISSNHRHQQQMELKLKDIPEKYFMVIAHFLSGDFNDTEAMDRVNGPLLKASIKSVYWLFLIQYALLALAGIAMNVSIIAYAMYNRLYKDVTHAFIVNLALCHLVQCALVLPITLMVMLIQNWIFGQFLCFFLPMLQDIPLHVAIISHILIAWDRMRWLSDPLQGRLPAFVCCCATWLTGMVIALPYPIYTIYVELGDYVTELNGIGLCVVNLMDDMHEYMRGLFLLMYCAPSVLLAYLYIRTSQELRPPDGPFAVMMFEHRADMRNRQRNSSASSVGCSVGATNTSTSGIGSALTTHTNGGASAGSGMGMGHNTSSALSTTGSATTKTRSYDLYSAELDVYREKRKQRNFGSMAAAQILCLCPLMILRFARLSMEETYENQKHFDFTYLMFVWIAFLPTVIFPCIYASQILPRDKQERIRGYFRLSTKRFHKSRSCGGSGSGQTPSSREDSIEKDDNTNATQATSIVVNGEEFLNGGGSITGTALVTRHELNRAAKFQQQQQQHHNNCRQAGKDSANGGAAVGQHAYGSKSTPLAKDVRVKKNDVKIKIISDGGKGKKSTLAGIGGAGQLQAQHAAKSGSRRESVAGGGGGGGSIGERKLTLGSLDNSCSNMTSSTYCNGGGSLLEDDGGASNFGDGEDSSIVSGMIVSSGGQNGINYMPHKKWSLSGQPLLRNKDLSFSDCSSFSHMETASTLERDMEIIDMLERERSMDIQEMIEREKHGETVRMTVGERRKLPDIEKIYQRSPKAKLDPYNYDVSSQATPTPSTATAKDSIPNSLLCSDPLQSSGGISSSGSSTNDGGYSVASTFTGDDGMAAHRLSRNDDGESGIDVDEEVPSDFFDKYTPGAANSVPYASSGGGPAVNTPTSAYQYQYSRRLSRKSSHHSQGSNSHRTSKRDSFNSLNGSDLIAGAFGELDPTQPLSKMSVVEGRMRRSSGRTSSFSSSARSSMKSRDYNHGSSHSAHPELDFRENIFAEL
ncbi:PREDICTED: uncharacterized protein LOC108966346 [Bactrocera latifrons]|uniref:uncharacterized protein LOC108966346 n=1 Tax=Bactrocera latifrons TaxID=174628 RepID=UPI0008DD97DB|nr:PREDICTED: uncharacterized protein LOC108966346 [Bactrocera latifrons]